jgi:hypothetical protein
MVHWHTHLLGNKTKLGPIYQTSVVSITSFLPLPKDKWIEHRKVAAKKERMAEKIKHIY